MSGKATTESSVFYLNEAMKVTSDYLQVRALERIEKVVVVVDVGAYRLGPYEGSFPSKLSGSAESTRSG